MPVDLFATERHFVDHLAPVWAALAPEERGLFVTGRSLSAHATARSIDAAWDLPAGVRPVLTAAYGDVKRARAAGRTAIAYLEHGIGQAYGTEHPSYAGGRDRDDVSLFLVPNAYAAALWSARYPEAAVAVVGSPRIDHLPALEPQPARPVVALSFHWDCLVAHETRSALGRFLPAFPLVARAFTVIGHGHPRAMDRLAHWYRRYGIEIVRDFDDVLRRADVYVCDNSSSIYEFAATGRPVVVLNPPWYRRDVHHGLRFWEAASVGPQCSDPARLVGTIDAALADPPEQRAAREEALRLVYAYRDGRAADRAAAVLSAWAVERERRVA